MKKTFSLFFSFIIILAVAASVIPVSASSAADNKAKVYRYLTDELSFNSAAACGIMANMEHESRFDSTAVARDSNGLLSGGLCMWNGSRFRNLQNYCNNNGYNYLSIAGQLEYLAHELKNDYYKHIYNYLKKVSNSSQGAADAAYYWCYYFEIPSNRSYQAQKRAASASSSYWPKFGDTTIKTPKITSNQNGKKIDLAKDIKISIDKLNGNSTNFILLAAKKKNSGYDWSSAKIFSFSSDNSDVKLSADKLGIGDYAIKGYAENSYSGKKSDNSNKLTISVACLEHDKKLVKETEPTFKKSGSRTLVCSKCGLRETTVIDKLSKETIESSKVSDIEIAKKDKSSITLSWSAFANASGYNVFISQNGKWVKLKTLGKSNHSYTVKSLKSATRYSFRVVAFVNDSAKKYYSMPATISSYTRPNEVKITSFERFSGGKVAIGWDKVTRSDGYSVYVSTDPNSGYKAVKDLASDELSYTVSGLKSGTCYYFYVKAFVRSDSGNITYSDISGVKFAIAK